jgi:hypothetical protein
MSADNWRQEYHLTPNGWIKRTDRSYGHVQGDPVERPIEAVETWEEHITQSSIYSERSPTNSCCRRAPRILRRLEMQ